LAGWVAWVAWVGLVGLVVGGGVAGIVHALVPGAEAATFTQKKCLPVCVFDDWLVYIIVPV
jgi:xanthosine utilization system XapX-like protein